jgi:signal transduction histidine kinase
MRSLNERLAARGGRLAIDSVPGGGTSVRAELPLARNAWRYVTPGPHVGYVLETT